MSEPRDGIEPSDPSERPPAEAGEPDPQSEPLQGARKSEHRGHNAMIFLISELIGRLAAFATFAAAARLLGPSGYGEFSYAYAFALLATSLAVWGFDMAVIQLGRRDNSRMHELLTLSVVCRVVITALILFVVAMAPFGGETGKAILLVMTATTGLETINGSVRSAAAILDRQRSVAFNFTIQKLVVAGLALGALFAGYGPLGMAWAYFAGTAIGVAAMLINGARIGATIRLRLLTRAGLRQFLRQSRAPGTANLLNEGNARFDTLALGWFGTLAQVGVLGAANRLYEATQVFFHAVTRAAVPALARTHAPARLRVLVRELVAITALLYLPVSAVMVFRGGEAMALLFGAEYGDAGAVPMAILGVALLAYVGQSIFATVLQAQNHSHRVARNSVVSLIAKLTVTIPLVIAFGTAGAAAAVLVAYTVQLVAQYLSLSRVGAAPRLGRTLLGPVIATVAMSLVLATPLGLIPACALATAVYGAVWLLLAGRTDPQTVSRIRGMVRR